MWLRALFIPLAAVALVSATLSATPAHAAQDDDCYHEDVETRIRGCTELLGRGNLLPEARSGAYSTRALGYSQKRDYGRAIEDYNQSLKLTPNFATALNNRAWAYFRWGKGAMGRADVERALELSPDMDAAYDTRAHIRQINGEADGAMEDYQSAMDFGGERMVLMYQCGLKDHGLYKGPRDGFQNDELKAALQVCSKDHNCDPLPADEHCRPASS
jgi:tetratricopeptide (TPR) repeat protein